MTNAETPAPYPPDTRAKGWRFELDHERIMQSDTWALTPSEVRPWLLMIWMVAWQQTPCGSLPKSDELIAARIGMQMEDFKSKRQWLLRGWWAANDGRQYHDVIVLRVQEMLTKRRSEADRKAATRAKNKVGPPSEDDYVHKLSQGTQEGLHGDYTVNPTPEPEPVPVPGISKELGIGKPTPRMDVNSFSIIRAMRDTGMSDGNASNPSFMALVAAGASLDEFRSAAETAVKAKAGFNYALTVVSNAREKAAELAKRIHNGPMQASRPSEPTWSEKQAHAVQTAVPGIAARHPSQKPFIDAETSNVTSIALGR
jgi:hypothetical protein